MICEDRPPLAHGLGRNRTLIGTHPHPYKAIRQLPVGLLPDEFIAGVTAPEINSGYIEEFACRAAEQLNQCVGIGAFARLGSNAE